ncbi:MAG: ABC transporter permease [Eubacteriales bacterium]|nr:ABC transporter permease [Eubacteriales bacterium]
MKKKKERRRRSVLSKDMFREIGYTKARFISVIFMILLGVTVSVGVKITSPIMKETLRNYIEKAQLYDIRITSDYPLEEDDLAAVRGQSGVVLAEAGHETALRLRGEDTDCTVYAYSDAINVPDVTVGHAPQADDEILLDDWLRGRYAIGDRIVLERPPKKNYHENDPLKRYEYKVSGFARSILHMDLFADNKVEMAERIAAPRSFGFVRNANFREKTFDSIYLRLDGSDAFAFGTEENRREAAAEKRDLAQMLRKRSDAVYAEKRNDIKVKQKELEEAKYKLKVALQHEERFQPEEISDMRRKLDEVQEGLDKVDEGLDRLFRPGYKVSSRYDLLPVSEFFASAEKLNTVADIFSGFFFMIAILVSLTTMTRMVEEQRIQIGTLKALGYPNVRITRKYFVYGSLASTAGIIGGLILGHWVLMPMVFSAYSASYNLPDYVLTFHPVIVFLFCGIAYLCTTLSAAIAVNTMLKKRVAVLMRGKPPKKGTRIFLERFRLIWRRMNFFQKVSARNVFRYKARMWMTISGIAGCTGLLFLGFSLKSSIISISDKQFEELFKYTVTVAYNPYSPEKDIRGLENRIQSADIVTDMVDVYGATISVSGSSEKDVSNVTMFVADEGADFSRFINFRNMAGDEVKVDENGVKMTLKLARVLKVETGGQATVSLPGEDCDFRVSDIIENYVGHALYLDASYYKSVTKKVPLHNMKMLKLRKTDGASLQKFIADLKNDPAVFAVDNLMTGRTILDLLASSMNAFVYVMVVCSILLALVVLYNLTNINISERVRELSTIKVLGFYPREITRYIYRETLLLTVFGQALGLLLGNIMHAYVVLELPPDMIMLDPRTYLRDYGIAIGITFGITLLISIFLHRKLKHVNMVESLKAIE